MGDASPLQFKYWLYCFVFCNYLKRYFSRSVLLKWEWLVVMKSYPKPCFIVIIWFWTRVNPIDGVGRISCGHYLYHASPFCSITCILFHRSSFLHFVLYLFYPRLFRSSSSFATVNFKAFTITFSSSFLKTWPYHHIPLALAIPLLYTQHVHQVLRCFFDLI